MNIDSKIEAKVARSNWVPTRAGKRKWRGRGDCGDSLGATHLRKQQLMHCQVRDIGWVVLPVQERARRGSHTLLEVSTSQPTIAEP